MNRQAGRDWQAVRRAALTVRRAEFRVRSAMGGAPTQNRAAPGLALETMSMSSAALAA
jgi:hypothetical protein